MSFPKVQELRNRVMERVAQVRGRVGMRGMAGQQVMVGKGALIEQARRRADEIARRLAERRPGIIPMVKEFKPGQRVRQFFPAITDNPNIPDMAIESRPAKPADGRDMAVFVE